MWMFTLLSWLTKLTRGTDFDDNLVSELRLFFMSNPRLSADIFKTLKDGVKNGFDFDDDQFVNSLLDVVFKVIETQAPEDPGLGSNKL